MCGIAGTLDFTGAPLNLDVVRAMGDRMRHRGPDHAGFHLENPDGRAPGPSLALVHRRLSIIDLSERANQPMPNEDGTLWLVFNGEIYNFKELRSELLALGHRFRCDSDGEVILHGFETHGEALFARLNGMFALALWNSVTQTLYLVRDRYGKKPLYYHHHGERLSFASELKALAAHPDLPRAMDPGGLARYLHHEFLPGTSTILKGVHKVAPGVMVRFSRKGRQIQPYWTPALPSDAAAHNPTEAEACARLEQLLRDAVARRLVSDVPLGVFLSGGLDSSAVLATMRELLPDQEISTFSVAFREASFDESSHARRMAEQFHTRHHELTLTADDLLALLPDLWRMLDEPYADPSLAPTHALARFAKQRVTVIMGGDGGDEMFMGYDPFLAHALARWYERMPRVLHRGLIAPLVTRLPVSLENMSLDFKAKQFLRGVYQTPAVRNQYWLAAFLPMEINGLMDDPNFLESHGVDLAAETEHLLHGMGCRDWADAVTLHFQRSYLAGDILPKLDMAGMAVSLEMRSPFLDPELGAFATALPTHLKMRYLTQKYCLKQCMRPKLPASIIDRRKKGFGIPVGHWIRHELKERFLDASFVESLRSCGMRADVVRRLVQEHLEGRRDHRKPLWTLFVLSQWHQHGWIAHPWNHDLQTLADRS